LELNHGESMAKNNIGDIAKIVIAILILLYVLWFISHHSTPVTLQDLFTVWGGTLASFGIFFTIIYNKVDKSSGQINNKIDRLGEQVNSKIDKLSEQMNKMSGYFDAIKNNVKLKKQK
jgi:predicted PurR-regulated permease PerM